MIRSYRWDVDESVYLEELGLTGSAYAAPIGSPQGTGFREHELVVPASVMKVQVALTVENMIARGQLNGGAIRKVPTGPRTPGPTGMSLMRDQVHISVRDLVTAMMTISDNVATDDLISLVGLDAVNRTTFELGMERTRVASDLGQMLEDIAREVGFAGYAELAAHDPDVDGAPTTDEVAHRIGESRAMDPTQGTGTTAYEMVTMLQAIWTDQAGEVDACRNLRAIMARQLTRNRIASGFSAATSVSAKSGALFGIVRNEVGVVKFRDGAAFAVAIFTRSEHGNDSEPAEIDAAIGRVARMLVDELR